MERARCLWCGKEFDWDSSMYEFCDDCISKIGDTEETVERMTKVHINLAKELETELRKKRLK